MSFLAGNRSDVTDQDRDDAHSYEHPDCEACGLEICASEFTCGCPPERTGRRLRVDGMRTQLHAVCEAKFVAEFAAAKTDKVTQFVPVAYDREGTPGLACLSCNSAWPASESPSDCHHAAGCTVVAR